MLKKVDDYNEIAEHVGGDRVRLMMQVGAYYWSQHAVEDLASFRKLIRHEYVECIASRILNSKEYEFGKEIQISCVDKSGDTLNETVEFYIVWG